MMLWTVLDMPRLPAHWPEIAASLGRTHLIDRYVLRAKGASAGEQWELARTLVAAVGPERVVVADRADVARSVGALGVHLPADGLGSEAVRSWWPEATVSRAIHTDEELGRDTPDVWLFGHLWPTRSKPGLAPRGLDAARAIMRRAERPVLGIGGVTAANAPLAREAGLAGVAVVDAIWQAADAVGAARAIREALGDAAG